ncbi:MFS transporter [Actinoplanes sp. NPDC049668]|uniref:MFS transporter n=1 Tax=unclassified Actinoplanes TaxID=2626549 RepID=UPI0033A9FB14
MTTYTAPTASTPRSRFRTVATTVAGNFIEYFDWLIFGLYAPILAQHFFPGGSALTAVLGVFSAYAAGMFFRPLGGILAGRLADRRGRRVALLLSISLMGGGSLVIGLLPAYASIGVAAPVLLFLARAAQGLSAGGEWPAAVSYLMELAPRSRRCLYGSYFAVSSAAGGLAAAMLGLGLGAFFGAGAMAQWAWRVPFLVGAALSGVLLLLRRQLAESEPFARARRTRPRGGLRRLLREHPRAVVVAALFVAGLTINTTTWTTVAPALAQTGLHADPAVVYAAVSASIGLAMLVQIPFGLLADRVGVLPMLTVSLLGFAVAGPIALAAMKPSLGSLVLSMGTGLVLMACLTSVMPKLMAALFPVELRASGLGLPHGIANSLAGGLTPFIATYLAGHGRFGWYLGLLVVAAALAWVAGWIAVRRMSDESADPVADPAPRGEPLVAVGHR